MHHARIRIIATYFSDKIERIKAAITVRLNGVQLHPIHDDRPFDGDRLLDLAPVRKPLLS